MTSNTIGLFMSNTSAIYHQNECFDYNTCNITSHQVDLVCGVTAVVVELPEIDSGTTTIETNHGDTCKAWHEMVVWCYYFDRLKVTRMIDPFETTVPF